MKKKSIFLIASLIFSSFTFVSASASIKNPPAASSKNDDAFRANFLNVVKNCIHYNSSFSKKEEMIDLVNQLEKHGVIFQTGSDDLRAKFIGLQGCIEHTLACSQALGETIELMGMIHAPMPATPLCTKPEPLDITLLDESIRYDRDKLLTVRSRSQIIREYLLKGGKLYVVYPKGGLEKRSSQQQTVYLEELARFSENLFDWPLSASHISPEMVGATYFFRNSQKQIYIFSIKATQVSDPKQESEWALWFGPLNNAEIDKRVNAIFSSLRLIDGPPRTHFPV